MPATSQPANFFYTSSAAPLPLPQLSSQTELTSTTQVTNISSEQELLACRSNATKTPKKTLATHSADINEGQSSSGKAENHLHCLSYLTPSQDSLQNPMVSLDIQKEVVITSKTPWDGPWRTIQNFRWAAQQNIAKHALTWLTRNLFIGSSMSN